VSSLEIRVHVRGSKIGKIFSGPLKNTVIPAEYPDLWTFRALALTKIFTTDRAYRILTGRNIHC
jgi:hypothetical protein